jgi:hypothetical protein
MIAAKPLPAQRDDRLALGSGGGAIQPVGTRRAVRHPRLPLGLKPANPFAHRSGANAKGRRNHSYRLVLVENAPNQSGSTIWGQAGILVNVHSGRSRKTEVW